MSLRARVLVAMGVVVGVLALVGVVVNRSTEKHLIAGIDAQLERAATRSAGLLAPRTRFDERPTEPGTEPGAEPDEPRPEDAPPAQLYVAVLGPRGEQPRVVSLPNTTSESASPPDLDAAEIRAAAGSAPFTTRSESGGLRYRVLVLERGRFGGNVVVGLPLENVESAMRRLRFLEAGAFLVIVAVLGLVTSWVLRLGVRPLKEMTSTATAIGEGDLARRIPESTPGTEAGELGSALNQMLGRIQMAFDERTRAEARLRQFVSDASHELRTPVTTIRGYAELYRKGGLTDPKSLDDAMQRTEAEAVRMGELVEDLLRLARLDEGRPLRLTTVRFDSVIGDAARDFAVVDPSRPLHLTQASPVSAVADEALLRQVVANLLSNVRTHTPPGTRVELSAVRDGDDVVLTVADDGPGMSEEHAERAFERFYRADSSRDRHTGGSGLGLSIVAAVLDAHGGSAEMHSSAGTGTTVRLRFPVAGPGRDGRDTAGSLG